MSRFGRLLGLALVLAMLAGACGDGTTDTTVGGASTTEAGEGASTTAGEAQEVASLLSFLRIASFYPMLLAEGLGYYEEEGITTRWEATDGSAFAVQQVAAGNADFAVVITEPAILGFAESPNFRIIYNLNNETTGHLNDTWALASSGITSHADLAGKKIGVKDLADGAVPGLRAAMALEGLEEGTDYELVPLGESPAAQAEALLSGEVAAFRTSIITFQGTQDAVTSEGDELVCISCDIEEPVSSLVVIASDQIINENPELVVAMGRALARAQLFGQTNPEAGVTLLMEADPEVNSDPDAVMAQLQGAVASTTLGESGLFGVTDVEAVRNVTEFMLVPGLDSGLEEEIDVDAFVKNDLIEQFNDFDHDLVVQEANNY